MAKKPMDTKAWLIAGVGFALAFAALAARLYASAQMDLGFLSVSQDAKGQTILATKKGFFLVDKAEANATFAPLNTTGLTAHVTDMAAFENDLLVLDARGQLARCTTAGALQCKGVPLPISGDLAKLGVSENGAFVAITDNQGGTLHVLDAKTWKLMGSSSKKFGNPNRPVFTADQLLLADNTGHAIQAWPRAADALRTPNMSVPHSTAHKTRNQPYFFEKDDAGFLVLEAGTMLANAKLVRYGPDSKRDVIETGLADAVSMVRTPAGSRLLAGMQDQAVVELDASGRVSPFGSAGVRDVFRKYWDTQSVFKDVMKVGLWAMVGLFVLPMVVLLALGYNLGSKPAPEIKPPAFQGAAIGETSVEFPIEATRRARIREIVLSSIAILAMCFALSIVFKDFRILGLFFFTLLRFFFVESFKASQIASEAPTKFTFLPHHLAYLFDGRVGHAKYTDIKALVVKNRIHALVVGAQKFERVPPISTWFAANQAETRLVALLRRHVPHSQVFESASTFQSATGIKTVNKIALNLIIIAITGVFIALLFLTKYPEMFSFAK
jgi:hypothetical protein